MSPFVKTILLVERLARLSHAPWCWMPAQNTSSGQLGEQNATGNGSGVLIMLYRIFGHNKIITDLTANLESEVVGDH